MCSKYPMRNICAGRALLAPTSIGNTPWSASGFKGSGLLMKAALIGLIAPVAVRATCCVVEAKDDYVEDTICVKSSGGTGEACPQYAGNGSSDHSVWRGTWTGERCEQAEYPCPHYPGVGDCSEMKSATRCSHGPSLYFVYTRWMVESDLCPASDLCDSSTPLTKPPPMPPPSMPPPPPSPPPPSVSLLARPLTPPLVTRTATLVMCGVLALLSALLCCVLGWRRRGRAGEQKPWAIPFLSGRTSRGTRLNEDSGGNEAARTLAELPAQLLAVTLTSIQRENETQRRVMCERGREDGL